MPQASSSFKSVFFLNIFLLTWSLGLQAIQSTPPHERVQQKARQQLTADAVQEKTNNYVNIVVL
jgi:hypothetical protein